MSERTHQVRPCCLSASPHPPHLPDDNLMFFLFAPTLPFSNDAVVVPITAIREAWRRQRQKRREAESGRGGVTRRRRRWRGCRRRLGHATTEKPWWRRRWSYRTSPTRSKSSTVSGNVPVRLPFVVRMFVPSGRKVSEMLLLLTGHRRPTPGLLLLLRLPVERKGYVCILSAASAVSVSWYTEEKAHPRVRSIKTPCKSCPRTFSWLACALPSAPPEYHAHTLSLSLSLSLSLLVSPTGAVGAMHFGNATNYATYLEAKKTSQDANATLAQQEEASAVVATMEKEKTERLSAQGEIFLSCLSPLMLFLWSMFVLFCCCCCRYWFSFSCLMLPPLRSLLVPRQLTPINIPLSALDHIR